MSLLWRERLLISLAPGELRWVRISGMLKPKVRAKGGVQIDPGYGAHPWDGALAALRAESASWIRDHLSARIVLSNHFVRYSMVTPVSGVSGPEEELALARFQFNKVHGEISRGWDIRLSTVRSPSAHVACATDSALMQALRQSFPDKGRARLTSVQPLLMSVYNASRGLIPGDGAWLVLSEADRTCLALIKGKTWHAIQNIKGSHNDAASWIALVERERWRVSLESVPATILVHATHASTLPRRNHGSWTLVGVQNRWPSGLQPASDGAYLQAVSAA